jgi:hypothetical protein
MSETNTIETMTTTTETETTAPVVVENKSDNAIVGVSKADKAEITAMREQFIGAGATKEYAATEKEFIGACLHVVKNRRYEDRARINEEGTDWERDEDGKVIYDLIDHLDLEMKRTFALRPTKPAKIDYNDPAVLRAQMARIQAKLQALGLK